MSESWMLSIAEELVRIQELRICVGCGNEVLPSDDLILCCACLEQANIAHNKKGCCDEVEVEA